MRTLLAPSILSADFARLAEEVASVEAGADYLHVDVMDGRFVPNLTIGPPVIRCLRPLTRRVLDVHLMIEEPERSIADYAAAGADIITVHVEACRHLHRTLQEIRGLGKRAGVSLNPATPPESLACVLGDVDLVLVMSVNPGFGGQRFIPGALDKLRWLRGEIDGRGLAVDLEVDGGIKVDNIAEVARAGANVFVSGSGVFGEKDRGAILAEMRKATEAARE